MPALSHEEMSRANQTICTPTPPKKLTLLVTQEDINKGYVRLNTANGDEITIVIKPKS